MTGKLTGAKPTKSNKKKVFEWQFEIAGEDPIPIEVYLQSEKDGSLYFRAHSRALDNDLLSQNIDDLHKRVEQALIARAESLTNMVWEDWLEIQIGGNDGRAAKFEDWKSELQITVRTVKRGVSPKTGEVLELVEPSIGEVFTRPFPKPSKIDKASLFRGEHFRNGTEISFVPDTPENRVVLSDVHSRLRELRSRLAELMSQESISLTDNKLSMLEFRGPESDVTKKLKI